MTKVETLKALLDEGDKDGVVGFFSGMSEKERREFSSTVRTNFNKLRRHQFVEISSSCFGANPLLPAAEVAIFCTSTLSELKKTPFWATPAPTLTYDLLVDRQPGWTQAWIEHLLADDPWSYWPMVRKLVRNGIIGKPEHPNYITGMIPGLTIHDRRKSTVMQELKKDPALLEDEIWQLFEFEGSSENSLANHDRWTDDDWSGSLVSFIHDGTLSRERLIACSLAALQRGFNHYRAKWFFGFYDAIETTAEEDAANAMVFLDLLRAPAPNVVSWALKKVQLQAKANVYKAEVLVSGLEPIMRHRSKKLVKTALKLIAKTLKLTPKARDHGQAAVFAALTHESVDIQTIALDLLDNHWPNQDLSAELSPYLDLVSTTLGSRLAARLGESAPDEFIDAPALGGVPKALRALYCLDELAAQPTANGFTLAAARFDGTELFRLDARACITPIQDLDELVAVIAQVLENAAPIDDVERALDGLARLCGERPDDFERRVSPLAKRIDQLTSRGFVPFVGLGPAADFCGLVHAWACGETARVFRTQGERYEMAVCAMGDSEHVHFPGNLDRVSGALSRRNLGLGQKVANATPSLLLATPTHAGGFIAPQALVERINAWRGEAPAVVEVVLALLRLAPDGRPAALRRLKASGEEWVDAIRHALGDTVDIGSDVSIWAAAARARAPWLVDDAVQNAFPNEGPDVGTPADWQVGFAPDKRNRMEPQFQGLKPTNNNPDCIPVVFHHERAPGMWELGGMGAKDDLSVLAVATIWPGARESYFAATFTQILGNIDWWEAAWHSKRLMEPLLEPCTPLRTMGCLLLVTGLGAKEPGEHGLATDAAIIAIEDGRLGSDNWGAALNTMLGSGLIKAGRWAARISDIAQVSPAHALTAKFAVEELLSFTNEPPRDFAKILELLLELSVQFGFGITGENRDHLASVKGKNKTAKAAKALLQVPTDSVSVNLKSALNELIGMRIDSIPAP